MTTICCIGTGPSLTAEHIAVARDKGFTLYGCNNAYQLVPDLQLLYGCNYEWWAHYWPQVKDLPAEKWTTNEKAATEFGIRWIAERNAPGLSLEDDVIHHGHGSGFSLVSMAWRARPERIVLLGYDLRYAVDYDGFRRQIGSTPRHYFGEYPSSMQHWPRFRVERGVHHGLLELYQSVADQGAVEIINATPGSALACFPVKHISRIQ